MIFDVILIALILLAAYYTGIFRGAPFVPTKKETLERMINAAQIQPGNKVADIGSGDGRIIIAAAQAGGESHGYEINPLLVIWSIYKINKAGLRGRAFVHWKSFWGVDYSQFDIVTLFGVSNIMKKLGEKLKKEMKPGSKVVSNIFQFPNWQGEKHEEVYVYRIEKTS